MELMKVPRVESTLRVFAFTITFTSQVSGLRRNLNAINDATIEVKESAKLRQIMQTILTLGNALNQGTTRGPAIGFKLDILVKLSDTCARNNKMLDDTNALFMQGRGNRYKRYGSGYTSLCAAVTCFLCSGSCTLCTSLQSFSVCGHISAIFKETG